MEEALSEEQKPDSSPRSAYLSHPTLQRMSGGSPRTDPGHSVYIPSMSRRSAFLFPSTSPGHHTKVVIIFSRDPQETRPHKIRRQKGLSDYSARAT